ncbi:MAG: MarR family transcriptional regulator [Armatimonadota bacterium]|jgi:DNA-binding MarR family transcriptional regulator
MVNRIAKALDVLHQIGERYLLASTREAGDGLTPAQVRVLRHVHLHGMPSVRSIAEGLMVSPPAATQLVNKLVAKRLVERSERKADRRVVDVRLTPRGRSLAQRLSSGRRRQLNRLLARMPAGSREELVRGLENFISAALSDEQSIDGACLRCGNRHAGDCPVNEASHRILGAERARV